MENYRLYAKFEGQRQFKALDINRGIQVTNLIYATIVPSHNLDKLQTIIKENKEVEFKIVKIK